MRSPTDTGSGRTHAISYLTMEHRGPIAAELHPKLGNWIFGSDICQEICPWNDDAGGRDSIMRRPDAPRSPNRIALDEEGFLSLRGRVYRLYRATSLSGYNIAY